MRPYVRAAGDQAFLLPPDIRDWLPEEHQVWAVRAAVEMLEVTAFEAGYRVDGAGRPPYDPRLLLRVLLFAYCDGVRSSRAIEQRCERDIAYRVLADNLVPDHATLARFRRRHLQAIDQMFLQVLRLLAEAARAAGTTLRIGLIALDGTKTHGNASGRANRSRDQLEAEITKLREQVAAMLTEAEHTDTAEDAEHGGARGDELPDPLRKATNRLAALKAAKTRLDTEVQQAQQDAQAAQDARRAQWERDRAAGKKLGRKPGEHPPKKTTGEPKINLTDPDSKTMQSHGRYYQGYNVQAVATPDQVILAVDVTTCSADTPSLHPMLQQTRSNLDALGVTDPIRGCLADSGYGGAANLSLPAEPLLLIPTRTGRRKDRASKPPQHPALAQMTQRLANPAGKALFRRRAGIIEPCFGQIKNRLGDRSHYRGQPAIRSDWTLAATSHNLLKLLSHWHHTHQPPQATPS